MFANSYIVNQVVKYIVQVQVAWLEVSFQFKLLSWSNWIYRLWKKKNYIYHLSVIRIFLKMFSVNKNCYKIIIPQWNSVTLHFIFMKVTGPLFLFLRKNAFLNSNFLKNAWLKMSMKKMNFVRMVTIFRKLIKYSNA